MKLLKLIVLPLLFLLLIVSCKQGENTGANTTDETGSVETSADIPYKDMKSQVSYIIGYDIGSNMKRGDIDVDMDIILTGLKDAYTDKESVISQEDQQKIMAEFQAEMRKKQEEKQAKAQQEGIDFLEKNKKKKGVVTLESGLQYKVITEGDGPIPTTNDTVKTHYRGTLIDGTEFDSSYKRNQPATFPVTGVIKGWTEALQLMPVGSKWELYIPSDLAYGKRGSPPNIGPDATLIFEIELLGIETK